MTEHHGLDAETIKTIGYQVFNVTVMFGALGYLLTGKVKAHFKQRKADFTAASQKAEQIRKQAEEKLADIRDRLSKLENTKDESIQRANAEAADLKKQMLADAQELARRLQQEAKQTAELEVEKAKALLHAELAKDAVAMARAQISEKVSKEDHQRLQGQFISSIEGAST